MSLEQEALEFLDHVQKLYFEYHNMESLIPFMKDEISWVGTEKQEIYRNLEEIRAALSLKKEEKYLITHTNYRTQHLSDEMCIVYGEITVEEQYSCITNIKYHVSSVCSKTAEGMKLVHLHTSCPKSESFIENIPGGVHKCKYDTDLTLINMSNSFLSIIGYTRKEIKECFHNHYREMIFPVDRSAALTAMKEQLQIGNTIEIEYRIRHKDGKLIWILDKGKLVLSTDGTKNFYCVISDITEQKEEKEELRLSVERHKIIMDQTTDIIFEWNMKEDTLSVSSNWRKKFGFEPIRKNINTAIARSSKIHPDDMDSCLKLMRDSAAGIPYSETEFRIQDILGEFRWCRVRVTVQYDSVGAPIKATGIILNIDEDKRHQQSLIEQARQDSLTGLLNKAASKSKIDEMLKQQSVGILFIIDLDDFKGVNDRFGHLCGDAVLTDVAHILQHLFRTQDVVGRIGGDEFLVFLPELPVLKAEEKAQEMISALRSITFHHGEEHISCSIGGAAFPRDAVDFYNLYQCADQALYHVKTNCRGGCAVYTTNMFTETVSNGIARTAVNTVIESEGDSVNEQLAKYSFQMLYHAIDVKTAVNQILEIVGKAYDVSRAYIFESSKDGLTCSNTFEWCGKDVTPEMNRLQNLSYKDDLDNYLDNFNENGIFYCKDIKELRSAVYDILATQDIRSVLQCAIMDDGQFKGYVGFDECRENRYWTKEQVESLTLISNVLSTFLLKLRFKERVSIKEEEKN